MASTTSRCHSNGGVSATLKPERRGAMRLCGRVAAVPGGPGGSDDNGGSGRRGGRGRRTTSEVPEAVPSCTCVSPGGVMRSRRRAGWLSTVYLLPLWCCLATESNGLCPPGSPLRFVSRGTSMDSGTVEVAPPGGDSWFKVCLRHVDSGAAAVLCRQLGFVDFSHWDDDVTGYPGDPMSLVSASQWKLVGTTARCQGDESCLSQCRDHSWIQVPLYSPRPPYGLDPCYRLPDARILVCTQEASHAAQQGSFLSGSLLSPVGRASYAFGAALGQQDLGDTGRDLIPGLRRTLDFGRPHVPTSRPDSGLAQEGGEQWKGTSGLGARITTQSPVFDKPRGFSMPRKPVKDMAIPLKDGDKFLAIGPVPLSPTSSSIPEESDSLQEASLDLKTRSSPSQSRTPRSAALPTSGDIDADDIGGVDIISDVTSASEQISPPPWPTSQASRSSIGGPANRTLEQIPAEKPYVLNAPESWKTTLLDTDSSNAGNFFEFDGYKDDENLQDDSGYNGVPVLDEDTIRTSSTIQAASSGRDYVFTMQTPRGLPQILMESLSGVTSTAQKVTSTPRLSIRPRADSGATTKSLSSLHISTSDSLSSWIGNDSVVRTTSPTLDDKSVSDTPTARGSQAHNPALLDQMVLEGDDITDQPSRGTESQNKEPIMSSSAAPNSFTSETNIHRGSVSPDGFSDVLTRVQRGTAPPGEGGGRPGTAMSVLPWSNDREADHVHGDAGDTAPTMDADTAKYMDITTGRMEYDPQAQSSLSPASPSSASVPASPSSIASSPLSPPVRSTASDTDDDQETVSHADYATQTPSPSHHGGSSWTTQSDAKVVGEELNHVVTTQRTTDQTPKQAIHNSHGVLSIDGTTKATTERFGQSTGGRNKWALTSFPVASWSTTKSELPINVDISSSATRVTSSSMHDVTSGLRSSQAPPSEVSTSGGPEDRGRSSELSMGNAAPTTLSPMSSTEVNFKDTIHIYAATVASRDSIPTTNSVADFATTETRGDDGEDMLSHGISDETVVEGIATATATVSYRHREDTSSVWTSPRVLSHSSRGTDDDELSPSTYVTNPIGDNGALTLPSDGSHTGIVPTSGSPVAGLLPVELHSGMKRVEEVGVGVSDPVPSVGTRDDVIDLGMEAESGVLWNPWSEVVSRDDSLAKPDHRDLEMNQTDALSEEHSTDTAQAELRPMQEKSPLTLDELGESFTARGPPVLTAAPTALEFIHNEACGGMNATVTAVTYVMRVIESPLYPAPYNNSATCRWVITPPDRHHIFLAFLDFWTEERLDFLHISGEDTEGGSTAISLTGKLIDPPVTRVEDSPIVFQINASVAVLEFTASGSGEAARGFRLAYWAQPMMVPQILAADGDTASRRLPLLSVVGIILGVSLLVLLVAVTVLIIIARKHRRARRIVHDEGPQGAGPVSRGLLSILAPGQRPHQVPVQGLSMSTKPERFISPGSVQWPGLGIGMSTTNLGSRGPRDTAVNEQAMRATPKKPRSSRVAPMTVAEEPHTSQDVILPRSDDVIPPRDDAGVILPVADAGVILPRAAAVADTWCSSSSRDTETSPRRPLTTAGDPRPTLGLLAPQAEGHTATEGGEGARGGYNPARGRLRSPSLDTLLRGRGGNCDRGYSAPCGESHPSPVRAWNCDSGPSSPDSTLSSASLGVSSIEEESVLTGCRAPESNGACTESYSSAGAIGPWCGPGDGGGSGGGGSGNPTAMYHPPLVRLPPPDDHDVKTIRTRPQSAIDMHAASTTGDVTKSTGNDAHRGRVKSAGARLKGKRNPTRDHDVMTTETQTMTSLPDSGRSSMYDEPPLRGYLPSSDYMVTSSLGGAVHGSPSAQYKVPKKCECALSGKIMEDPVLGPDGYLYERDHITEHIQHSGKSPITGRDMTDTGLLSATELRKEITSWFLKKDYHETKMRQELTKGGKKGISDVDC